MPEKNIIEKLRGNPVERTQAIQSLLSDRSLKSNVWQFIKGNRGDLDDAKMVFHDTIVAFTKYVFKNRSFQLQGTLSSYLMGMARNLWITELRKKAKQPVVSNSVAELEFTDDQPIAVELILKGEKKQILNDILDRIQSKCKEVLLYWSAGYSMKEIAERLQYKSDGVVRKKKSECMKSLYALLSENPQFVSQLRNA